MPNWKRIVVSGSDATLNTLTVSNGITGSLFGTSSFATQALSASFAPSTPAFPFTGSAIVSGSLTVTGSLNNNGRINVGGVYAYSPTSSGITIVAPNVSTDYKGNLEIFSNTTGADNGGSILLGGMQPGPIMYGLAKIVSGYVGSGYGGYLSFWTEAASSTLTEKMRINKDGLVGIGTTTPTAVLHLKAGTATANTAPFKFTSGTNLTTPEAGAVEFDGNSLFFTTGSTRSTILTSISPASITGSAIITGSLTVTGSFNVTGLTTRIGNTTLNGNLVVTGSLLLSGSSLVAGITPIPLAGTIQDGVTSVLGSLNDWNSNFYQGTVLYSETAAGTITFGQLCYRTQNETWELADATAASAAAAFNMLGICVKSSTATNPTSILINGFVETATYAAILKSGEPLYMSITPGSMTKTAPTTVGNAVRIIGNTFWDSNTNTKIIIRFNPESSWIEL